MINEIIPIEDFALQGKNINRCKRKNQSIFTPQIRLKFYTQQQFTTVSISQKF